MNTNFSFFSSGVNVLGLPNTELSSTTGPKGLSDPISTVEPKRISQEGGPRGPYRGNRPKILLHGKDKEVGKKIFHPTVDITSLTKDFRSVGRK